MFIDHTEEIRKISSAMEFLYFFSKQGNTSLGFFDTMEDVLKNPLAGEREDMFKMFECISSTGYYNPQKNVVFVIHKPV